MLNNMTYDLQKIGPQICYHLCFDRISKLEMGMFDEVRRAPWRYAGP
jgi:hypothetical protein